MRPLPDDVERLIARCLETPLQLEALLRIAEEPQKGWTAARLASALHLPEAQAARRLEELCARALLAVTLAEELVYRYAPATPELERGVSALQRAWSDSREAVLSRILARGRDPLRAFSDAFKLGKKGGGDRG